MTINATFQSNLDTPTTSVSTRRLSVVAGVLWLGAATFSSAWWLTTDDWELWYLLYSLLLTSAAALTAGVAVRLAQNGSAGPMARLGTALTVLAACTTLIGWALPIWMLSIAIGYVVFAIVVPGYRRALGFLAFAQLAGLAVVLVGEAVGVGAPDDWGGHPAAGSAGVTTCALLTAGALVLIARQDRRSASTAPLG